MKCSSITVAIDYLVELYLMWAVKAVEIIGLPLPPVFVFIGDTATTAVLHL